MVSHPSLTKPQKGEVWLISCIPQFNDEHSVILGLVVSNRHNVYTLCNLIKEDGIAKIEGKIDTFIFKVKFIRRVATDVTWREERVEIGKNKLIKTDYFLDEFDTNTLDSALTIRRLNELNS